MQMFGGSINLMSMGGLAVAIGLVIDDAVVVVENIHRRAQRGRRRRRGGGVAADGAARQLDADDGRGVRAARAAVGRGRPVLPRAVAEPVGGGAACRSVSRSASCPLLARWAVGAPSCPSAEPAPTMLVRTYARWLNVMVTRPILAVVVAVAAGRRDRGPVPIHRDRIPAAGRRRRLRRRLPDAGRQRAWARPIDRSARSRAIIAATPEVAAYSRRTGSELGLFATAQNTGDILVRLKPRGERDRIVRGGDCGHAAAAPAGRAARRDRVRPAAAGHARRSRGQPDADRGEDLRRRHGRARRRSPNRSRRCSRRSTASLTSSACSAATRR